MREREYSREKDRLVGDSVDPKNPGMEKRPSLADGVRNDESSIGFRLVIV